MKEPFLSKKRSRKNYCMLCGKLITNKTGEPFCCDNCKSGGFHKTVGEGKG